MDRVIDIARECQAVRIEQQRRRILDLLDDGETSVEQRTTTVVEENEVNDINSVTNTESVAPDCEDIELVLEELNDDVHDIYMSNPELFIEETSYHPRETEPVGELDLELPRLHYVVPVDSGTLGTEDCSSDELAVHEDDFFCCYSGRERNCE